MAIATGTAALIGAGISAAGTVAGSAIQSGAANRATDAQLAANREAEQRFLQYQREHAAQARADLAPFREAQLSALSQLQGLTTAGNPLEEAQRSRLQTELDRALSARGLQGSSGAVRGLGNIELGLANQRASLLSALAGNQASQQSAQISQQTGQSLASGLSGLAAQRGQIQAQNAAAQGAAFQGLSSGLSNVGSGYLNSIIANNRRDELLTLLGLKSDVGLKGIGDIVSLDPTAKAFPEAF